MKPDPVELANAGLGLLAVAGASVATVVGAWWRHATHGPDLTKRVELHAHLYANGPEIASMQERELDAAIAMLQTRKSGTRDIPITYCRACKVGIEWHNRVWWEIGTCRTSCPAAPPTDDDHDPVLEPYDPAPTGDPRALDEWLRRQN